MNITMSFDKLNGSKSEDYIGKPLNNSSGEGIGVITEAEFDDDVVHVRARITNEHTIKEVTNNETVSFSSE